MNKQQLAAKIWESANQMRSKIEANEYKDYILGFIFYKYLCDKEVQFALKEGYEEDDLLDLSEEDAEAVDYFKRNLGYFISYENLFSTWINKGKDFDVANVQVGGVTPGTSPIVMDSTTKVITYDTASTDIVNFEVVASATKKLIGTWTYGAT